MIDKFTLQKLEIIIKCSLIQADMLDLKQLFDGKNQSYIKESGRNPHNSGNKISRQQSRI